MDPISYPSREYKSFFQAASPTCEWRQLTSLERLSSSYLEIFFFSKRLKTWMPTFRAMYGFPTDHSFLEGEKKAFLALSVSENVTRGVFERYIPDRWHIRLQLHTILVHICSCTYICPCIHIYSHFLSSTHEGTSPHLQYKAYIRNMLSFLTGFHASNIGNEILWLPSLDNKTSLEQGEQTKARI